MPWSSARLKHLELDINNSNKYTDDKESVLYVEWGFSPYTFGLSDGFLHNIFNGIMGLSSHSTAKVKRNVLQEINWERAEKYYQARKTRKSRSLIPKRLELIIIDWIARIQRFIRSLSYWKNAYPLFFSADLYRFWYFGLFRIDSVACRPSGEFGLGMC